MPSGYEQSPTTVALSRGGRGIILGLLCCVAVVIVTRPRWRAEARHDGADIVKQPFFIRLDVVRLALVLFGVGVFTALCLPKALTRRMLAQNGATGADTAIC
jgi:hypothetical protein